MIRIVETAGSHRETVTYERYAFSAYVLVQSNQSSFDIMCIKVEPVINQIFHDPAQLTACHKINSYVSVLLLIFNDGCIEEYSFLILSTI